MSAIKGYKELTAEQIDAINHMKDFEAEALSGLKTLSEMEGIDRRWLSIARTNIEQGYMAAIRSITKPNTVEF